MADDLLDSVASEKERDEAIARVEKHANQRWMLAAYNAVKWCAVHHRQFTTNEVWARLQRSPETTHEARALGPVMANAARNGLIRNSGQYRRSQIPRQHGRPVPVWRSLIDESK